MAEPERATIGGGVDEPPNTCTAPSDPRGEGDERPLSPGARVGRYVIEALLGAGGMGLVYRAIDPALQRPVAIKLLRRAYAMRLTSRRRFAREGQALARITHPHIATVFDVGDDGEHSFLALELLDGGTLRAWLATPRRWREIERMFTAIAQGLAAAHDLGIVHRDVKPDNVLLTRDGVPRLSDFGVAGLADGDGPAVVAPTMTVGGAVLGTPAYMAPEQRAGGPVDARADLYSLCLAWLEALGRDRDLAPSARGDARGPAWLVAILLRGLAADPEARWPTVAAMLGAIRRRRRVRTAGIVALGAAAIAAAVTLWPRGDRPVAAGPATVAPSPAATTDASVASSPPPPPVILHRDRVGEGHARRLLTGDGESWVVSGAARDALWLEERATGERTSLVLPAGRLSKRTDALAAASVDGAVVVVRMEDLSVWRTGRGVVAPVRLHERGNGPVCLDATGARVAISANQADAPIEIRATDDARLLATTDQGHVCAWAGERLVLGWRDDPDYRVRLRLVDLAGGRRDLPTLPGELSALTVVDDWVVVAHEVESSPAPVGALTAMSLVDGTSVPLLAPAQQKFNPPMVMTAIGLNLSRAHDERGYWLGDLTKASPPLAFRPIADEVQHGGEWLDAASLAISTDRRVVRHDVVAGTRTTLVADGGHLLGRVGDGVVVKVSEAGVPGRCVLRLVHEGGPARALASGRCLDLRLQCDGVRRCVVGERDGDDLVFRELDPVTGVRGAFALQLLVRATPAVAIAPDGRWLVEHDGDGELVDPRTGTRTPIRADLDRIDDLTWGHDGRYAVAFGRHDGDAVLARLELRRLGPTKTVILARSQAAGFAAPRVSPDGKRLLLLKSERPLEYLLVPPPRRSGDTTAIAAP